MECCLLLKRLLHPVGIKHRAVRSASHAEPTELLGLLTQRGKTKSMDGWTDGWTDCSFMALSTVQYFLGYKKEFLFQNNPKDLDPSYKTYKMDLDFGDCLRRS